MIRLFKVFLAARSVVLFLTESLLISASFLVAANISVEGFDASIFLLYEEGLLRVALVVFSIQLGLYFQDLYTRIRRGSRLTLIQKIFQVMGIAFLLQALLAYVDPPLVLPTFMMVLGAGLSLILLIAWRLLYSSVIWKGFGTERILFLGTSPVVERIVDVIGRGAELGFTVLGYLDDARQAQSFPARLPLLGSLEALSSVVAETRPHRIVLGISDCREALPVAALLDLRLSGMTIESASELYEAICGRFCLEDLRPSALVFSNALAIRPGSMALQSIYTNVLGLAGLVLAAPLLILIGVVVRLSSRGPVLAGQRRIGFKGIPFTLFRFRCVRLDGRTETLVGHWLRKWHLDALPQIMNVVRGEMALVGPRPERPEFARVLGEILPYYQQRHCVKPGIMGWSQIHGQYVDAVMNSMTRLEYDLYYIRNASLLLDIYICLRTVKAVFFSRGNTRRVLRDAAVSAS